MQHGGTPRRWSVGTSRAVGPMPICSGVRTECTTDGRHTEVYNGRYTTRYSDGNARVRRPGLGVRRRCSRWCTAGVRRRWSIGARSGQYGPRLWLFFWCTAGLYKLYGLTIAVGGHNGVRRATAIGVRRSVRQGAVYGGSTAGVRQGAVYGGSTAGVREGVRTVQWRTAGVQQGVRTVQYTAGVQQGVRQVRYTSATPRYIIYIRYVSTVWLPLVIYKVR